MTTAPLIQDCVLIIGDDTVGFEITGTALIVNNLTDAPTKIYVNAGGTAYVLDDRGNVYGGSGTVEPLASDRAVWDALGFADRHANDIDVAAGIHHTQAALDARYSSRKALVDPLPRLNFFEIGMIAAGVTRSGSTTDGHLAVWNGSNANSIKDGGSVPAGGGSDFLVVQVFS